MCSKSAQNAEISIKLLHKSKKSCNFAGKLRMFMEGTLKTRQLTEYKTLSDGRNGCLVFVGPKELEHFTAHQKKPAIYMLEAS